MFPGFHRALPQRSRICLDYCGKVGVIEAIGGRVNGNWNRCGVIKLIERSVVLIDELIVNGIIDIPGV